mmetsp:Transcript_11936/g.27880  ORF Transcript_11936/g.27880 Transcript_11936/m.27880 type:complete len:218 (+) Transcript_11936:487-1140(+)
MHRDLHREALQVQAHVFIGPDGKASPLGEHPATYIVLLLYLPRACLPVTEETYVTCVWHSPIHANLQVEVFRAAWGYIPRDDITFCRPLCRHCSPGVLPNLFGPNGLRQFRHASQKTQPRFSLIHNHISAQPGKLKGRLAGWRMADLRGERPHVIPLPYKAEYDGTYVFLAILLQLCEQILFRILAIHVNIITLEHRFQSADDGCMLICKVPLINET